VIVALLPAPSGVPGGVLAAAKGGEGVKSGPIGLAVILVLCVAVYFLFKSMSKHLKKVRDEFPTDEPDPGPRPAHPTASPAAADQPEAPAPADSPGARPSGPDTP
jgi:hypothetical protein